MAVFELVIALLFVGAVLSAVARRVHIPYPALLALAGASLALIPGVPTVTLDAELALTLFVAPVLLDAAFDSSPRDLKDNWRPVFSLALTAVGLTVVGVALVARAISPELLPWSAAIALGAIVAPPDAAAATAVLRQLRLPHRVLVILEGESLFNDASALLIYRLAVGAAVTGTFSGWSALPMLALVCAGSLVLGWGLSFVIHGTIGRIEDVSTSVILQFLSTFAVWILAEALHLSGIITLVVYAIFIARRAPTTIPARIRIPSYAVWEVAVFVLNVLAFILVGLQLKPILASLGRAQLLEYLLTSGAVCAAVIGVRIVWVMSYHAVSRARRRRPGERPPARLPSTKSAMLVAWCGMRGIVTLAAALALPPKFPGRDLILFTAFSVVLVTLVIQGMTLTPLIRKLGLEDDGTVDDELLQARAAMARAGFAEVDRAERGDHEMLVYLHKKYAARLARAEAEDDGTVDLPDDGLDDLYALQRQAQRAERQALSDLRARGVIGDDAFHKAEEELDWAEVNVESMARKD